VNSEQEKAIPARAVVLIAEYAKNIEKDLNLGKNV
jgi:hypothetical protein